MSIDGIQRIAIAVVERDGQFLIGKRPPGVPLAGYWEFPGGKAHAGENLADAAVRECLEETGLAVEVAREYFEVTHGYDHGQLELHFFACRCQPTQQQPHAPFRWVPRDELRNYHFPEANGPLLELLVVDEHPHRARNSQHKPRAARQSLQ